MLKDQYWLEPTWAFFIVCVFVCLPEYTTMCFLSTVYILTVNHSACGLFAPLLCALHHERRLFLDRLKGRCDGVCSLTVNTIQINLTAHRLFSLTPSSSMPPATFNQQKEQTVSAAGVQKSPGWTLNILLHHPPLLLISEQTRPWSGAFCAQVLDSTVAKIYTWVYNTFVKSLFGVSFDKEDKQNKCLKMLFFPLTLKNVGIVTTLIMA